MYWTVATPNSYVEALTPNLTVLGAIFKEVIKI